VLSLWDRILGYDSLVILPTLAAAIINFRTVDILQSSSREQVTDLFVDMSKMKVVPLLQSFLFDSDRAAF
jgi:hypothetical protein